MKNSQDLIKDFEKDAETMGFKCKPHIVCLLIYDTQFKDDDLCIRLDLFPTISAYIYKMHDKQAKDLDKYSWLFSRVAELFRDLNKEKKSNDD